MKKIFFILLISQIGFSQESISYLYDGPWEFNQGNTKFKLWFYPDDNFGFSGHYEWSEIDSSGNETITFTTNKPIPYCLDEDPCPIWPGIRFGPPSYNGDGSFSSGNDKLGGFFKIVLVEQDCIQCPLKIKWNAWNGYFEDGEMNVPEEFILTQVD